MTRKIAICQSNYIPWKGYFDLINSVDEFILYDDMQYTKRNWRNRNLLKTADGLKWLTIPVKTKGKYYQKIKDVEINDNEWNIKHWNTLKLYYSKARHFKEYSGFVKELYLSITDIYLSRINYAFIKAICRHLGVKTKISWSMDYTFSGSKTTRLVDLCLHTNASHYLSGPSAKNYIEEQEFHKHGIQLEYMDYSNYPEYNQLYSGFEHGVSILDLIFNEGDQAPKYMLSFEGIPNAKN